MTDKSKILVAGDVEGKFDALFKRVGTINKKSGPFDLLLCVGNFFGINNKEFLPYRIGDKKVLIPTYILGPNKDEHIELYPTHEEEFELCNNVYYFGKRGIYTTSKGVKIAYISGVSDGDSKNASCQYSSKDVSELCDLCLRGNPTFRGVDILLTSQWPAGIIENEKQVSLTVNLTSDLPSYLIMKLKPRYIISGLEGVYYERSPFRCPVLGDHDTTLESVTRFIGLARVGNLNKEKWIYALSLTPIDKMKIQELLQKTIDESVCPFSYQELEAKIFKIKRKQSGPNQYFYDMAVQEDEKKSKYKNKKARIEFDQSKCWFCLASPSVEKHLIISVGNSSYLALAKGGLVEEHFLICPIEHYQSTLGQPPEVLEEITQFKDAIRKFYDRNDRVPVFFERNYKTSHMQLQVIPIPKNAQKELKEIFVEESEGQGINLNTLDSFNRLDQVVPPKVPYFTVELPDGTILYTKIEASVNFPLNFAREVLATGPILNLPDKIDWRDCILSKEDEEGLVQKLRSDYEPFDFTL